MPDTMTKTQWRDDLARVEARIEPFLRAAPTGERYIDLAVTPGPLIKAYDALTQIGLERGWLTTEGES